MDRPQTRRESHNRMNLRAASKGRQFWKRALSKCRRRRPIVVEDHVSLCICGAPLAADGTCPVYEREMAEAWEWEGDDA